MKRFFAAVLLLLMICGCSAAEPLCAVPAGSAAQSEEALSSAAQSSSDIIPEKEQPEMPEVELQFEEPARKYNIIAELPTDGGYVIVYEEQMDDEFNRRFSNDGTFWGLYAQLFDADGKLLKTVDFDRHNLYSIPTPVSRLSCENGVIYFESRHTLDNLEQPYEMDYCFYLATDDGSREIIKPYNKDDWYRMKSYYVIEDKDGVSFQIGSEYNEEEQRDRTVLRLVGNEYGESRVLMDYIDPSINSGLYRIVYSSEKDPLYDVTIEMDTSNSQVTVQNAKTTLKLDFAKCVSSESYRYTEDMLDDLIAVSPDGKSEVWAADVREYFESASGCDYVVKNESGIYRLCPGNDVYNVAFVDNDIILINSFGSLEMYNDADGSLCKNQPQFDYGEALNPYNGTGANGPEKVSVGIAVDRENDVILIAHRQNTFGSNSWIDQNGNELYELPVTLTVLNSEGEWFCDIETGLKMPPYDKFTAYSVDISCQNGIAALRVENSEALSAEVAYLPMGLLPSDKALSATPKE